MPKPWPDIPLDTLFSDTVPVIDTCGIARYETICARWGTANPAQGRGLIKLLCLARITEDGGNGGFWLMLCVIRTWHGKGHPRRPEINHSAGISGPLSTTVWEISIRVSQTHRLTPREDSMRVTQRTKSQARFSNGS
jgi:hypothetical protein